MRQPRISKWAFAAAVCLAATACGQAVTGSKGGPAQIAGQTAAAGGQGYRIQQFDQGLCRIGLERCQNIYGFGAMDCVDRYQYCLTVLGPRSGYTPPSRRGFPPPPPPVIPGPPSPGEDVYFNRAEPQVPRR